VIGRLRRAVTSEENVGVVVRQPRNHHSRMILVDAVGRNSSSAGRAREHPLVGCRLVRSGPAGRATAYVRDGQRRLFRFAVPMLNPPVFTFAVVGRPTIAVEAAIGM